ncbi:hypothetical protein SprV_0200959500 [Sparganum proliferum]
MLFRRLKFLTADSDTTVCSSTQFLEKDKGVSLLPNEVMVSFDVTCLFISILHDLAIETVELLLRSKYNETENRLGHAQVLQLLKFCLKTYFTFDGTIYEQVKGTPIGSPISGFIAEAVLQRSSTVKSPEVVRLRVDGVKARISKGALRTYFAKFGEVISVDMTNSPLTHRHCGTGFVTVRFAGDVSSILNTEHTIRGVQINVWKRAGSGQPQHSGPSDECSCTEVSSEDIELRVDGVKAQITEEDLRAYFSRFGEVLDVEMNINPSTGGHCGNGNISLRTTWDVNSILVVQHVISGVRINVRERTSGGNQGAGEWSDECSSTEESSEDIDLRVNGVKANITVEDLRAYFSKFGEVLDVKMAINPSTGRHCGNGHISLRTAWDVDSILEQEHIISGVRINVWEHTSGGNQGDDESSDECSSTEESSEDIDLRVNGVKANITVEDLRAYFSRFGEVLDVEMNINPSTGRHCGNGNISLRTTWDVDSILVQQHIISGVRINVWEHTSGGNQGDDESSDECSSTEESSEDIDLRVNGVKANITVEDLRAYFSRFGEVLDVEMNINPSTGRHCGNGNISLRTTWDVDSILVQQHIISGVRINVWEHTSGGNQGDDESSYEEGARERYEDLWQRLQLFKQSLEEKERMERERMEREKMERERQENERREREKGEMERMARERDRRGGQSGERVQSVWHNSVQAGTAVFEQLLSDPLNEEPMPNSPNEIQWAKLPITVFHRMHSALSERCHHAKVVAFSMLKNVRI